MHTKSYISAAALAAALLATPQMAHAQVGLNLDLGVVGVDANVDLGGENLVDVDAGVNLGGDDGIDVDVGAEVGGDTPVSVDAGVSSGATPPAGGGSGNILDVNAGIGGNGGNLVDVNVDSGLTGPNGGTLIDLGATTSGEAPLDVDVDVLPGAGSSPGTSLITGDIRIAALGDAARGDALRRLIADPNLADIDLDAAIDDRRVSIVALGDLLGQDELADIRLTLDAGGEGRTELLDAVAGSLELASILDTQGIAIEDVVAVQVAENGATEVLVLEDVVEVALLGDDGDLADAIVGDDLADLDVDLLSPDELAELDLDLLPDDLRSRAQLRLLGIDGDAADLTVEDLAAVDLDLISNEELAELDLSLLPEELAAPVQLRLLGNDRSVADLSVGDLAEIDLALGSPGTGTDGGSGGDTGAGDGGTGTGGGDTGTGGGGTGTGGGGTGTGGGDTGSDGSGTGNGGGDTSGTGSDSGTGGGNSDSGTIGGGTGTTSPDGGIGPDGDSAAGFPTGTVPGAEADAGIVIATLGCDIGTLALASGMEATPQAIASADALELVRIEGCERQLVDSEADAIRDAIHANPAIVDVLDGASIPLDQVIGATVQAGTLTLFIEPVAI